MSKVWHNKLRRLLLGVLAALAVVPSSAVAEVQPERLTTDSLQIASEFWGANLAGVRVFAVDVALIRKVTGNPGAVGTASAAMRIVWIAAGSGSDYVLRIQACTIIVHEVGHVLGLGHSLVPRSVMGAYLGSREVIYECYRRFLPAGRAREWREQAGGAPLWLTR